MSAYWLKMIGTTESPCLESYTRNYADFARRPRRIHSGDWMVLYAVGGRKCVFAVVEVTSAVYDSRQKRHPYRMDIRHIVNVPISSGVHIDRVSSPKRDLLRSIRRASYVELRSEEYERAATKLREASKSGGTQYRRTRSCT